MAKAYKCDRCGALYTDSDYKADDWLIEDPTGEDEHGYDYILLGRDKLTHKRLDLCPDCTRTINKFLNEF